MFLVTLYFKKRFREQMEAKERTKQKDNIWTNSMLFQHGVVWTNSVLPGTVLSGPIACCPEQYVVWTKRVVRNSVVWTKRVVQNSVFLG